jgi:hypothetical protein
MQNCQPWLRLRCFRAQRPMLSRCDSRGCGWRFSLSAMTYSEKLKDPRWQKMRLEIFERDNWRCVECKDHETSLHVHHAYYTRGLNPWEYPRESLSTLCEDCHSDKHKPKITPGKPIAPLEYPLGERWVVRLLFYGEEVAEFVRKNLREEWITSDILSHIKLLMDPGLSDASKDEIFYDCQKRFPTEFLDITLSDALETAEDILRLLREAHYKKELNALAAKMNDPMPEAELYALVAKQQAMRKEMRRVPWEVSA